MNSSALASNQIIEVKRRTRLPDAFNQLYQPWRYKALHGGRGSAKSWSVSEALIHIASMVKVRVLCTREIQGSIADSVFRLLVDTIDRMHFAHLFHVTQNSIRAVYTGSEFIFKGLRHNIREIKSTEGIDICWVEEAQAVSDFSWAILIPTIRKEGSEIWATWNPENEQDATQRRFITRTPPDAFVARVNWSENPFFPTALEKERQYSLSLIENAPDDSERATAQDDYDHIWEGFTKKNSLATIFRRRVVIEAFDEPPEGAHFHYGADWGFSNDPTALIRSWVTEDLVETKAGPMPVQDLWISHEAFGYGVELDETAQLFDSVPGSRLWPIKADCGRPEVISYMCRQGFRVFGAEKYNGSLEDGIAHVKAFRRIHIHVRCKHMQEEARLYSYKIDKTSGMVLPIVVDAHNHGWDALRYSLDEFIERRGIGAQWARLGQ